MTPEERAIDRLCSSLRGAPLDIKMVYIDCGDHMTPASDCRTIARFNLFGFKSIPAGGFDPDNDDHVADLGCWDWEADPNCTFPDVSVEACNWLQVLEAAARDSAVMRILKSRNIVFLFADHDGPVTVLM